MNLREFLEYRTICPICFSSNSLSLSFHSFKRQGYSIIDGRYLVKFDLRGIHKGQKPYKIGYSLSLDDNSFFIDFYTNTDICIENEAPIFLLNRFKQLDKNLKEYKIYKHCLICRRYNYSSNVFNFNYKLMNIGDLSINTEYFGLSSQINDGYKIFKLLNYYNSNESYLQYGITKDINQAMDTTHSSLMKFLKLPLLKCPDAESYIKKITSLIILS